MVSKDKIKSFAGEHGLDLMGVAGIERFEGLEPRFHPASIFPEAQSVIMIGREIPRGYIRGVEEGTHWFPPGDTLDPRYAYDLARFIEDDGWEGIPIHPVDPARWPDGIAVAQDRPAPNVSPPFKYACVAAGLGEIGHCGILLTPEFGPRQQVGMLITDLKLEPDPFFNGRICDREECMECVRACPFGAISSESKVGFTIRGREMRYADIKFNICRRCPNGATRSRSEPSGGEPNRLSASCIRACIAHLESEAKLKKRYHEPFRKREPWSLDIFDF